MTITAWLLFVILSLMVFIGAVWWFCECETDFGRTMVVIIAIATIAAMLFGGLWFFKNTASGQRQMLDQKSNLSNGIERTITVYTANGEIIAQYEGKIDIEGNDGGYVLFDYDGKRYMYYNCFVESIGDIS